MTEQQEQELLANVKSFTDHMKMVDEVFRAAKLGRSMDLVFQCGHSGLVFRGNYLRGWGRLYGIGLGPDPVSEVLDSLYDQDPPPITSATRSIEQIMHPLAVSRAQVDALLMDVEAINQALAIPAIEDPYLEERVKIIRGKQMANPASKLRNIRTAWIQAGRG